MLRVTGRNGAQVGLSLVRRFWSYRRSSLLNPVKPGVKNALCSKQLEEKQHKRVFRLSWFIEVAAGAAFFTRETRWLKKRSAPSNWKKRGTSGSFAWASFLKLPKEQLFFTREIFLLILRKQKNHSFFYFLNEWFFWIKWYKPKTSVLVSFPIGCFLKIAVLRIL